MPHCTEPRLAACPGWFLALRFGGRATLGGFSGTTAQMFGAVVEADLRCLVGAAGGYDTVLVQLKKRRTKGEQGAMGSLLAQRMDEAIDESRVKGFAEGRALGFAEGRALGFAEGRALGLAEGKERQRGMLLRLVARKFEADTAVRLKTLLAAVDDPGRLAGIVDHVIDSDYGDELLSRVTGAAELR